MPNIQLYTSNKLEALADKLADTIRKPLSSPLKPEAIVVQSPGMARWISMQMAERLGVWSNCKYYYPNNIIDEIFSRIIPDYSGERLFDTSVAAWQIMKVLPGCLEKKEFESLKEYLTADDAMLRSYQLSARIADTFDQYLTYRPDMMLGWNSGKGSGWQPELWRNLISGRKPQLPHDLKNKFFGQLKNEDFNPAALTERISVFGISSIPEFHLDILSAISGYLQVNIFFMNPCREYWADIYPEKNIAKTMGKYKDNITTNELHLEKGNSLLASLGRVGGDFFSMLTKDDNTQEYPLFSEQPRDSLLHNIQRDILDMTEPDENGRAKFTAAALAADMSVRVHSCHSPMRETEVLYDNILDMFNSDPALEPRDIIVMTPDIEAYSPYISAVFGEPRDERRRIPFSIADRSIEKDSLTERTFFAVLELKNSRFEAAKILDILENGNVLNNFGLTLSDLKLIREWIKGTNVSWGIDADFRGKLGLPAFKENTWESGLERMLLGYAMPGNAETMFQDILPYDIEGSDSAVLGKFIEYFNTLTGITESLSKKYTLSGWTNVLETIVSRIFDINDDSENIQMIRDAVIKLVSIEEKSDFHEEIEPVVIITWLRALFKDRRISSGFLTGGVTFCAMLPMRSIPFKAVCLMGLNDSSFPRADNPVSFDLISQKPIRGDRSRRDDDRYLFLEAIISAGQSLYISYTGQSIKDNSEIQPSVVVSELLDYIGKYMAKDAAIKDHILIKHPLQSFSGKYFTDNKNLFSYSEENHAACKITVSERKDESLFIKGRLSDTCLVPGKTITVSSLLSFFSNPAKYLCTNVLGIYLDNRTDVLDEKEPFSVEGLQKYLLEEMICGHCMAGRNLDDLYNIVRARGMLPHGETGRALFENSLPGIKNFVCRIEEISGCVRPDTVEVDLDIRGFKLTGRLDNIRQNGMLRYRYAKAKAADRIKAWIEHIILNTLNNSDCSAKSILICKNAEWEISRPQNCGDLLCDLLDLFIKGHNELIRFFPETSLKFADSMFKGNSAEKARSQAEDEWTGNEYQGGGEGTDAYYNLCFGNISPVNDDFTETSLKILEPMLKHQEKI
ncbi:MAG: exodeoxyribonuclease V subunit gamma [Spirochaetota bacterium]